jgi:hypothetical protein
MDSHRKDARDGHPDIDRRDGDGKRRRLGTGNLP